MHCLIGPSQVMWGRLDGHVLGDSRSPTGLQTIKFNFEYFPGNERYKNDKEWNRLWLHFFSSRLTLNSSLSTHFELNPNSVSESINHQYCGPAKWKYTYQACFLLTLDNSDQQACQAPKTFPHKSASVLLVPARKTSLVSFHLLLYHRIQSSPTSSTPRRSTKAQSCTQAIDRGRTQPRPVDIQNRHFDCDLIWYTQTSSD